MSTFIKCPSCGNEFEPNEVMREEMQKELRQQMNDWKKKKDDEYKQLQSSLEKQLRAKDEEADKKIIDEKKKIRLELESSIQKSLSADFENRLNLLQQAVADNEEKLKSARKKELDFLQKEQDIKRREDEIEISIQKKINEEREKLALEIRKIEDQKLQQAQLDFKLKLAEKDKQLEDQKKLAEEMKRKAEQGSMQLQGEILELTLEQLLKNEFLYDDIKEVKKGEEGADITQFIYNEFRQLCGCIVWESKRAKNWSDKWIQKLKNDMHNGKADLAVIVSQVLPKHVDKFGKMDGIWFCGLTEAKLVATILRESIIKNFETNKLLDNVSDKKEQLYKYMTSNEFKQKWETIVSTYLNMQKQLTREKLRTTKEWAERDKQLDIMLKNSMGFLGDVKGIGGLEIQDIKQLEDASPDLVE